MLLSLLGGVSKESRIRWAEEIRTHLESHPKAKAFIEAPGRKKALCANRRAGKTTMFGLEILARLIERDTYSVWVFAGDFEEYYPNWIRKPQPIDPRTGKPIGTGGLLWFLDHLGIPPSFYKVSHKNHEIVFHHWGSRLKIYSAVDIHQVNKARGGLTNLIYVDEAQKIRHLTTIISKIGLFAGMDLKADFWVSGTPNNDEESFFAAAAGGRKSNWYNESFYSWDNPVFGDSFEERYQRLCEEVRESQKDVGLTDEQMRFIESRTEETVTETEMDPIGKTLPDTVKAEFFGIQLKGRTGLVFNGLQTMRLASERTPYWETFSFDIDRRQRGEATKEDLLGEPEFWIDRKKALPTLKYRGGRRAKEWDALVSVDPGYIDHFGIMVWVSSHFDEKLYEFSSAKAQFLDSDDQREILEWWVRRLQELCGFNIRGVVMDTGGAMAKSSQMAWANRMYDRYNVDVFPAEKTGKLAQYTQMNLDFTREKIMILENSPLDIEMRYLVWKTKERQRGSQPEPDKKRRVDLPDETAAIIGDHCADAARYAWWWSEHVTGRTPQETPPETVLEALSRSIDREFEVDLQSDQDLRRNEDNKTLTRIFGQGPWNK